MLDKIFKMVRMIITTMKIKCIYAFFLFFICLHNSNAQGISITGKSIDAYLNGEYNRTFSYNSNLMIAGEIEINSLFALRSGFSFGSLADNIDLKAFARAGAMPFSQIPLEFSLLYIYNGILEYDTHSHTILPAISYNADIAGISIGCNFRFTSFFEESAIFETILSLSAYFNFIKNETLLIGVVISNFNDFQALNLGAHSIKMVSEVYASKNWTILSELEYMQSGSDGLTATFYGFAWKGGARYSW